jgi:hypothetical protein
LEGIKSERPCKEITPVSVSGLNHESLTVQLLKKKEETIKELEAKNQMLIATITSMKTNSIVNIKREESMNHLI